jgi:tetratricopeptide (TPR) repeat protein
MSPPEAPGTPEVDRVPESSSPPGRAEAIASQVRELLSSGREGEAATLAAEGVQRYPQDEGMARAALETRWVQQEPRAALALSRRLLGAHPDDAQLWVGRARAAYQSGAYAEAADAAELIHSLGVAPPVDVERIHALSLGRAGSPRQAEQAWQRYLEEHPDDRDGWLALGEVLTRLGEDERALPAVQRAIRLAPNFAPGQMLNGALAARRQSWKVAEGAYARASELEPRNVEAWHELGRTRERQGLRSQAETAYRRALTLDPGHAPSAMRWAALLSSRAAPEEARRVLETALRAHPRSPDLLYELGRLQLREGDPAKAYESLRQAHRILPLDSDIWREQGQALAHSHEIDGESVGAWVDLARGATEHEDYPLAYEALQRGLELEPNRSDLLEARREALGRLHGQDLSIPGEGVRLAQELLRQDRDGEALEVIAGLLAFDRSDPALLRSFSELLLRLGRPLPAERQLRKVLSEVPNDALAEGLLGETLLRLSRPEPALEAIDRALSERPHEVPWLVRRGEALTALGRPSEALDAFDEALRLNPASLEAQLGRGSALEQQGRLDDALESRAHAGTSS